MMKLSLILVAASVAALAAATPADARQGCGAGFHRTPNGRCVPNGGRPMWVVGQYYPGRGYWYNNRWFHHRYRDRDDRPWRYR